MKCSYCGQEGRKKDGFEVMNYCEECWWGIQDLSDLGEYVVECIAKNKEPDFGELKERRESQLDFNRRWEGSMFLIKKLKEGKDLYEAKKLLAEKLAEMERQK